MSGATDVVDQVVVKAVSVEPSPRGSVGAFALVCPLPLPFLIKVR